MTNKEVTSWLLEGDVSVQYQVYRDLLNTDIPRLRKQMQIKGWGKRFLSCRSRTGYWGRGFYQPKWTSTHYTLLDLRNLCIWPANKEIHQTLKMIFETQKGPDGGLLPIGKSRKSDVCVNGMALNYSSYFLAREEWLRSIVDFLLSQKMDDGGFNCHSNKKGATHSSLHTTLSVLEGITEYQKNGYKYRVDELEKAGSSSVEFILIHKLFRSDKTGKIIKPNFLKFFYPCRWYYDILRALDYFRYANVAYDKRMNEALQIIRDKQLPDRRWKLPSKHPGFVHFEMEDAGKPSRWNTLRAMRVLMHYDR